MLFNPVRASKIASKSQYPNTVNSTVLNRQNDWANIEDWGITGAGNAGDAAKFANAVTDIANAGGGTIYIPPGFIIRADATIPFKPRVSIVGGNRFSTIFDVQKTSSVVFDMNTDCDWGQIENICIQQNGGFPATTGHAFNFSASGTFGFTIRDCLVNNVWSGVGSTITSGGINNTYIENLVGLGLLKSGIHLQHCIDWEVIGGVLDMVDYADNRIPLILETGVDGPLFVGTKLTKGQYGVRFQNTLGGNAPRHPFFFAVIADGNDDACWSIDALHRANFHGCWAASARTGSYGALINGADAKDITWDTCEFLLSGRDGMAISNGALGIQVANSRFTGWGLDTANTYAGIATAANPASWFNFNNNKFINDPDFTGNEYRGIVVNSGTYKGYNITNNISENLTGGADSCVVDAGTASGAKTVSANLTL